jgi:hypothetical protein
LRFYREKSREKELSIKKGKARNLTFFSSGPVSQSASVFIKNYKKSLEALGSFNSILNREQNETAEICATILPLAAWFRRINPVFSIKELFNAVKLYCMEELEKINYS